MKKYTSYIACISILLVGATSFGNSNAKTFNLFNRNNQTKLETNQSQLKQNDINEKAEKRHRFSFSRNKKNMIDDKSVTALDMLTSTATQKVDKRLGKLLESREKIDVEIMKKVGNLNVDQYKTVDQFVQELTKNALLAIDLANKTNTVKDKVICVNYISKLCMLAQDKKWNEFKHGLTEFGNITFASGNLNGLKNNVISGIKTLFAKYFSPANIDAATNSVISNDSQKVLAIENNLQDRFTIEAPKELTINDDTKSMLDSLTTDVPVSKQIRRPMKKTATKSIDGNLDVLAIEAPEEDVYVPENNSENVAVGEDVASSETLNNQSFRATQETIAGEDNDIGCQVEPGESLADELTFEQLVEDNGEEEKNNTVGKISDPSIAVDDLSFAENQMLFEEKVGND